MLSNVQPVTHVDLESQIVQHPSAWTTLCKDSVKRHCLPAAQSKETRNEKERLTLPLYGEHVQELSEATAFTRS